MQEGQDSCIKIPFTRNGPGLIAIWAKFPNSDEDCYCPLIKPSPNGEFSSCSCISKSPRTVYDVELDGDMLCFNNLTRTTNNTKVLIVQDRRLNDIGGIDVVRIIILESQIFVQGK